MRPENKEEESKMEQMDRYQKYVYQFICNIITDKSDHERFDAIVTSEFPWQAMLEIGLAIRDGAEPEEVDMLCMDASRMREAEAKDWSQLQRQRIASSYRSMYLDQMMDILLNIKSQQISNEAQEEQVSGTLPDHFEEIKGFLLTSDNVLQSLDAKVDKIEPLIANMIAALEAIEQKLSAVQPQMQMVQTYQISDREAVPDAPDSVKAGGMVFEDEEDLPSGAVGEDDRVILDEDESESGSEDANHEDEDGNPNPEEAAEEMMNLESEKTGYLQRFSTFFREIMRTWKMARKAKKNALTSEDKGNLIRLICEEKYSIEQMEILQEMIEDINFNATDMDQIIRSSQNLTVGQIRQKIDLLRKIKQNGE